MQYAGSKVGTGFYLGLLRLEYRLCTRQGVNNLLLVVHTRTHTTNSCKHTPGNCEDFTNKTLQMHLPKKQQMLQNDLQYERIFTVPVH